jgi:carboxyl-terminal processing protease
MKRFVFTGAGVAIGFIAGLAVIARADTAPDGDSAYQALDRFGQAFSVVRADYVDPPDDKLLVENALSGMIGSLDPHSSYFDPKTYADMQVRTEGQYGGVGIVIAVEAGAVKVVSPIDDTPASAAGVKSGDVILAVDGKGLQGMSLDQVQLLLRGKAGTKVTLTLMRTGDDKSFDVKLTRAFIEVEAVKFHREGDVGYIRIPAFNEHTDSGLQTAVRTLKKQIGPRIKGYIIDLRDDGGGVLDQAIAVSNDFLEGGEIVSTRGRDPSDTQRYDAKPGSDITDGKPVVVLINRGTASASEIVAGALQDHKRARIVGMTSFGKGSVQTIIPINGGEDGALHLTTARYYTPSGRSIQATGIVPDIAVAEGDEAASTPAESYTEADLPHHLIGETAPKASDIGPIIRPPAGKKVDDFQLSYAVDLLDGKVGPKTVAERKE